jgi:hypothetical protein
MTTSVTAKTTSCLNGKIGFQVVVRKVSELESKSDEFEVERARQLPASSPQSNFRSAQQPPAFSAADPVSNAMAPLAIRAIVLSKR